MPSGIDEGIRRERERVTGLIASRIAQLEADFAESHHHTVRAQASGGIAALRKLGELLAAPEQVSLESGDHPGEDVAQKLRTAGAI